MNPPALVAVAHGSRDGRSAAAVAALAAATRAQARRLDLRLSFLDFNAPALPTVLRAVAADGHRTVIVVPLLLNTAYHARVDLPAAVAAALHGLPRLRVAVSEVLGAAPSDLLDAVWDRLREAGADPADPRLGVVLAAAGASDPAANAAVARLAATRPRTVAAFAAAARPDVPEALARLRAQGATRFAVAPWFLAPGRLLDRVRAAARATDPAVVLAEPLGSHRRVAAAVLERYRAAGRTLWRERVGLPLSPTLWLHNVPATHVPSM
ncbi:sirohydrochlorin chelatase [Pseudonocardia hispaniensis]|uniref:Sirohydrochlorin chelatase n=1 Tax=Pseudonocardia hispaniensis TaxID=904933 RepID=A0ABW1J8Q5_9PSEU